MKHKSDVHEKFKEFEACVSNDCGHGINTRRSDNGGEYVSKEFRAYLKSKGIHHELTVPHSPQQNGVAERMNRTLMECARSMLANARLSDCYWAEAVATVAYVRARTPTTMIKKTPYAMWYGKRLDLQNLKVFGCIAYAHGPDANRQKLDKKATKFRFVGYSLESKGYRLLHENTRKIYIRRDVIFNENDFGTTQKYPCHERRAQRWMLDLRSRNTQKISFAQNNQRSNNHKSNSQKSNKNQRGSDTQIAPDTLQ